MSIDTKNDDYQKEYSTLLAWLADSYAAQGQLDRAIAIREKQIALLRPLADGQANVVFRQHLIPAHFGLANLFLLQGNTERAIEHFGRSITESERLLPIEPDNAFWIGLAAQPRLQLAKTLLSLDRRAEATVHATIGCGQARRVLARDPGTAWRRLRTDCFSVRAMLAMAEGNTPDALRLAGQALASAKSERSADRNRDSYKIAGELRLLGDVRKRMGDAAEAKAAWSDALAQLPRGITERPLETKERAELLRLVGRAAEARPLYRRLTAMGYRNAP